MENFLRERFHILDSDNKKTLSLHELSVNNIKDAFSTEDNQVALNLFFKRFHVINYMIYMISVYNQKLDLSSENLAFSVENTKVNFYIKNLKNLNMKKEEYIKNTIQNLKNIVDFLASEQDDKKEFYMHILHSLYYMKLHKDTYELDNLDGVDENIRKTIDEVLKISQIGVYNLNIIKHPKTNKNFLVRNQCCLNFRVSEKYCNTCPW